MYSVFSNLKIKPKTGANKQPSIVGGGVSDEQVRVFKIQTPT
jgi:hypothetical protein